jgi:hypothetical protein
MIWIQNVEFIFLNILIGHLYFSNKQGIFYAFYKFQTFAANFLELKSSRRTFCTEGLLTQGHWQKGPEATSAGLADQVNRPRSLRAGRRPVHRWRWRGTREDREGTNGTGSSPGVLRRGQCRRRRAGGDGIDGGGVRYLRRKRRWRRRFRASRLNSSGGEKEGGATELFGTSEELGGGV